MKTVASGLSTQILANFLRKLYQKLRSYWRENFNTAATVYERKNLETLNVWQLYHSSCIWLSLRGFLVLWERYFLFLSTVGFSSQLICEMDQMRQTCLQLALWPSLNTQSCIRGLLVVRDFCFGPFRQLGQYRKKRVWADYEQLFRVVFSCFGGQKKF